MNRREVIEVWPEPGHAVHARRRWSRSLDCEVEYIAGRLGPDGHASEPIRTSAVVEVLGERGRLVRTWSGTLYRLMGGADPHWRPITGKAQPSRP